MEERVIGGRFELRSLLGRGGMSEVWLAHDRELERLVAVKLHALGGNPARIEREARAAAGLSHENVAGVYDAGEADGRAYLVLEYLPGGTLEDLLESGGPLPDEEAARIAREIASGLAHAHTHGVVHRDLKPSNVLFDVEGRAKLADFGIARALGQATLTETGTVLGTAAYLSPEQAVGEPVGPASDVYSFGVILFRMLTGKLPFEGDSPVAVALKHREEPPPPVRTMRSDAPPPLAALADAALAKDPVARPPDGMAVAAALGAAPADAATRFLASAPADDATAVLARPAPPRQRRRLLPAVAALAVLAAGGVVLAVAATDGEEPVRPSATLLSRKTTTKMKATVPAATTQAPAPTAEPTETDAPTTTAEETETTEPVTTEAPPTTAPVTTLPVTTVVTTVP